MAFRIENESQWNTDDLTALTERVAEQLNIKPSVNDVMLIFKTCRDRRGKAEKEQAMLPAEAARPGYYRGVSHNAGEHVAVIEIFSKERLTEKNTLDRMAMAADSKAHQDMAPHYIVDVAVVISTSLLRKYFYTIDDEYKSQFKWAEDVQFRAAPKITRSDEIIRRKIQTVQNERARVERTLRREMEKHDAQIAKLQAKLKSK